MIKIMQVCSSAGFGGGETVTHDLVTHLKNEFVCVVVCPTGFYYDAYKKEGIAVKVITQKKSILRSVRELRRYIRTEKPYVVHCQGTRAAVWGRLAQLFLKNKPRLIYTLHGFHIVRQSVVKRTLLLVIEKMLNHQTSKLVVVSEADQKTVKQYKLIGPSKIVLIRNGIDCSFAVAKVDPGSLPFDLTNKFVLTFVARLHPPKDFSTVLKAVQILKKQIPEIMLLLVGDGPLQPIIVTEIKDLQLEGEVKMLGYRSDSVNIMAASDLVVLSSQWEGMPITILESGLCHKPVVASNVDGINEIVKDGVTGYLFTFSNEHELAEKINLLYRSKVLREQMGEAGYLMVKDNFSLDKMLSGYSTLYRSL